jgi:hypothetical protein
MSTPIGILSLGGSGWAVPIQSPVSRIAYPNKGYASMREMTRIAENRMIFSHAIS